MRRLEHSGRAPPYRADVDGLRAIAVIPVVLFHARLPGFSGGFVGVDVFFVISGYLIAGMLLNERRQGRLSLLSFYDRRVRRIFPALFMLLFCSAPLVWYLFPPEQLVAFSRSATATALFVSNVVFWREAGYFDANAGEKPLLHTWSLAVEEQFYILFPLLLLLLLRWKHARPTLVLSLLALLSFALSAVGTATMPSATFFLAPTRAWELLLGSLLAVRALPPFRLRWLRELAVVAGVGMIATSVACFTPQTSFPGVHALLPCFGAALVIHGGETKPGAMSGALGVRALVGVGLISYSLYLWHWPLLCFAQAWWIRQLTLTQRLLTIALSVGIAALSWRYVERPFRARDGVVRGSRLFALAAAVMSVVAVLGLVARSSRGWPGRLPPVAARLASFTGSGNTRKAQCFSWPEHPLAAVDACTFGAPVTATAAIWGDSHADALADAIGKVAARHGQAVRLFAKALCPPIVGVEITHPGYSDCARYNEDALALLTEHREIRTVVLAARYAYYLSGPPVGLGPAATSEAVVLLTDPSRSVQDQAGREALFARQLVETVARLVAAGKTVVLVYPIPETGYHIPVTLARMVMMGSSPASFTQPLAAYRSRQASVINALDGVQGGDRVVRIEPHRMLCPATDCLVFGDDHPLYADEDHLSSAGANFVAPLFEPIF